MQQSSIVKNLVIKVEINDKCMKTVMLQTHVPVEQFYNACNRDLSTDLPFDSQIASNRPVQPFRPNRHSRQINNPQMVLVSQCYQRFDEISV